MARDCPIRVSPNSPHFRPAFRTGSCNNLQGAALPLSYRGINYSKNFIVYILLKFWKNTKFVLLICDYDTINYMKILYILFFIIIIIVIIGSFIIADTSKERIANIDKNAELDENIINNKNLSMNILKLTSQSFEHNGKIPSKHTCDGESISPSLQISGVDPNAKSLVLIMDDPDAPSGVWDHWVKFNIASSTTIIEEGTEPQGVSGIGTSGNRDYFGPCPPDREHRYFFKLYSLETELDLKKGASKKEVEIAMKGHILQQTELIGYYERSILNLN